MEELTGSVLWKLGLPILRTERLILRMSELDDVESEAAFYRENEDHLGPWFPDSGRAMANLTALKQFVPEFKRRALQDQGYRFQVSLKEEPKRYAGVVSLSRIQRGSEQTAVLGYGIAKRLEGHGYMSEAVRAVMRFAFDDLDLHRVEASYSPDNERSGKLLEACGFHEEGVLRQSLRINGVWRDHVLTAKINPNWRGVGRTERAR